MKLDLIGGSYVQPYPTLNSQRTINWYPVPGTQTEHNKNPLALFPTPGLKQFATTSGRYGRGIFTAETLNYKRCFSVTDTTLNEVGEDGTITSRGTLTDIGLATSKCYMTCNSSDEVFIGNPVAAYVFDMSTNTLTKVTDADYPGMKTLVYSDGYFIVNNKRTFYSDLNSGLNWTASSVFTPASKADPVLAVATLRDRIFNFGSQTIETYINDGTSPFVRENGSTVFMGLVAIESVAVMHDGIIFLGRNEQGQAAVYSIDSNYNAVPLSPYSINFQLNQTTNLDDAYAYIQYTKNGSIWYYLTIPSLRNTFVYDIVTKQWHERQSLQPYRDSNGEYIHREFRGRHYTCFNGKHLFQDLYSGKIFIEDYKTMTEDGNMIRRKRRSANYEEDLKFISCHALEIDCNVGQASTLSGQGSNPILMLETSKDGGNIFGNQRNILLGVRGNFLNRARLNKIGTARKWVVDLTLTDPVDLMIQSASIIGSLSSF